MQEDDDCIRRRRKRTEEVIDEEEEDAGTACGVMPGVALGQAAEPWMDGSSGGRRRAGPFWTDSTSAAYRQQIRRAGSRRRRSRRLPPFARLSAPQLVLPRCRPTIASGQCVRDAGTPSSPWEQTRSRKRAVAMSPERTSLSSGAPHDASSRSGNYSGPSTCNNCLRS